MGHGRETVGDRLAGLPDMSTICCCGGTYAYTETVKGCASALLSGASVTVTQSGTTIDSWTTNGSGLNPAGASMLAAGTYTVTIVATNYATKTFTLTITSSAVTRTDTLSAATGYSCSADNCCNQGGSAPYPVITYPSTIYINDGIGTITASSTGGHASWSGTATRTASSSSTVVAGACTGAPGTPINIAVTIAIGCTNIGGVQVYYCQLITPSGSCEVSAFSLSQYPCTDPTGQLGAEYDATTPTSSSTCPPAFAGSATWTLTANHDLYYVYGSSATITWSQ